MSMSMESIKMTDKFAKELEKYMKWAEENDYKIREIKTQEEKKWNKALLNSFNEPARNKLESYIKELIKEYIITKDNDEIEDAKLMAKEFKDYKPKKRQLETDSDKSSEVKEEKKGKRGVKKVKETNTKEVVEIKSDVKEKKDKKVTKKSKKENTNIDNIVIDMSLDTSKTFYLDKLEFTTNELRNKLGEPNKTGGKDDKHRYEWKIMCNSHIYSIYDWCRYGKFEELENEKWYIGGTSDEKMNVDKIIEFINSNEEEKGNKFAKKTVKKEIKTETKKTPRKTKKQEKTKEEEQEELELSEIEKELGLDELDLQKELDDGIETDIDDNEDKKSLNDELDTTNLEIFNGDEEDDMLDLDALE
jgi:hypothetical protein